MVTFCPRFALGLLKPLIFLYIFLLQNPSNSRRGIKLLPLWKIAGFTLK